MERHNMVWDAEHRSHRLPFDPKELLEYEFRTPTFLGRDRQCVRCASETSVDPDKARELVRMKDLTQEAAVDFSSEIVAHIRQTLLNGSVPS